MHLAEMYAWTGHIASGIVGSFPDYPAVQHVLLLPALIPSYPPNP